MSKLDLVTKDSVLKITEKMFDKYHVGYKPYGTAEEWGFCADLPQQIEALPLDYDVDGVIKDIETGNLLNIPHQGYCINKDSVISTIQNGWTKEDEQIDIKSLDDEIDRAIHFVKKFSFCGSCRYKNCKECGRYNAKHQSLVALDLYRHVVDLYKKLDEKSELSISEDIKQIYDEIKDEIQKIMNYSNTTM